MKSRNISKVAKKFESFQRQKKSQSLVSDAKFFKTHEIIISDAEIILPLHFEQNKFKELIAMIKCNNEVIWAQITDNSFQKVDHQPNKEQHSNHNQISILKNLLTLKNIQSQDNIIQGEVKFISKDTMPKNYYLEFVELYVKDVYLSRRDQFKIMKYLEEKNIHVYARKVLYFDKMKLEVGNILYNSHEIAKSGMIHKDTKIVFRSACSKYTILVEISKEMFHLNHENQLFLEKTIQFLTLFFLRNQFFQTKHRIEIILFARLFYPQFQTLQDAYKALRHEGSDYSQQMQKQEFISKNFAVSFQKDFQGRIYQDAYRKILWQNEEFGKFRQNFWEKVSAFLFTINWTKDDSYVKVFNELMEESIKEASEYLPQQFLPKKRPFQHYLQCELSHSEDSCFFQAISVVSEQYKHHYYFRSLSETGNAITIISAGKSHYIADQTTYKMAKSNIYLTNISCSLVNLRWNMPSITTEIICLKKKPIFDQKNGDVEKLRHLIDWCKEEDAYKSPVNTKIEFPKRFEIKSLIYPENIELMRKDFVFRMIPHLCEKELHYGYKEESPLKIQYLIKQKKIQFISTIFMNDEAYRAHEYFYQSQKFSLYNSYFSLFKTKKKNRPETLPDKRYKLEVPNKQKEQFKQGIGLSEDDEICLIEFQKDLKRIINKKNSYDFETIAGNSKIAKSVNDYIERCKVIRKNEQKVMLERIQEEKTVLEDEEAELYSILEDFEKKPAQTKENELDEESKEQTFKTCKTKYSSYHPSQNLHKSDKKCQILYQSKYSQPIFNTASVCNQSESIRSRKSSTSKHHLYDFDTRSKEGELSHDERLNLPLKNYRRRASGIIQNEDPSQANFLDGENRANSRSKLPNIFEETLRSTVYVAKKHKQAVKFKIPKQPSHNKLRLRLNQPGQNIHYTNLNFNQTSQKQLYKFIKVRHNNWSVSSYEFENMMDMKYFQYIQIEKQWKNILFPMLTPIYTNFRTNEKDQSFNFKHSKAQSFAGEEEICKYLMDNFQIEKQSIPLKMNLSKGHVHVQLSFTTDMNVHTFEAYDMKKQSKIVPSMFYRYLSYEDMDARFGSKFISFSDANFYDDQIAKDKKSVKLAIVPFCEEDEDWFKHGDFKEEEYGNIDQSQREKYRQEEGSRVNLQNLKAFIKSLKQKYCEIAIDEEKIVIGEFRAKPLVYKATIDLVKDMKNQVYHKEVISLQIDTQFHPLNVFTFNIQWEFCCAPEINDFIITVISLARKNKLLTHLVSRDDAFNTKWIISTIGQFVFESKSATQFMESGIIKNRQWVWDQEGYYMSRNGQAFLRFVENKNLVEWRQNTMKQSVEQRQAYEAFLQRFFLLASAYDFLGGLIDIMMPDQPRNQRLYSLSLST